MKNRSVIRGRRCRAVARTIGARGSKVKACFIYVGPIGDFGWSYQHHQGASKQMKAALGDKVETAYLESVPEGADAERAIERFARSGCNIIFTTSFGYMDPTNKVAGKFPDVKFEHATGYKRDHPNVATYNSKFYEGRYVQGVIAAKMSKAGVAGYIASFPIPEVVMGINAFMLGAQSVNPDFKVKVVWANTWFDPGKEADAAKALIDQGVDIITQHTDSTAPMQVADRARHQGLRPGVRHDQVRPGNPAHLDRRQLGAVLHRARQGGDRRHLEADRRLGRHEGGPRRDGALHQHAGRREEDWPKRPRPRSSRASSSPSPARSPSRTARSG